MQIHVHTDDQIPGSDALARWVQDEAFTRLARFREQLTRLEVFLSDQDGGKSGNHDKRCRLEARLSGRFVPLALIAVSAAPLRRACGTSGSCGWCRLMMALRIKAMPA